YSAIRVYSGLMGLSNQPPSSHSPTAPVHPPKGSQDLLSYTTRRGATVGLEGVLLNDRLKRLPDLSYGRQGDLVDMGWKHRGLAEWAAHSGLGPPPERALAVA
ncbi:MAG: hypothetical protein NTZ40_13775, partial [Cyanobacteria bacterium]|nr:hypothetical protein [Cyanobacteriota bacterium]